MFSHSMERQTDAKFDGKLNNQDLDLYDIYFKSMKHGLLS